MAEKDGQRWVTIKKDGPLHGRKILIDSKGFVVGGGVPKSFQGHHIGKLSGIDHSTDYDQYSHGELDEIHKEFQGHHANLKKELDDEIGGRASEHQKLHMQGDEAFNLLREIRKHGGIKMGDGDAVHDDYKGLPASIRKAVSNKNGKGIDELANEMGIDSKTLLDKLNAAKNISVPKVEDFHEQAKKDMGADYHSRKKSLDEFEKHVNAVDAAKRRKANEKPKEEPKPEEKPQQEDDKKAKRSALLEKHEGEIGDYKGAMSQYKADQEHAYHGIKEGPKRDKAIAAIKQRAEDLKKQGTDMQARHKSELEEHDNPKQDDQDKRIDDHNAKLKAYAQKFKSAEEFEKNIKPGMGQKGHGELFGGIDNNSHNHLDAKGIKKELADGGEHYFPTKVDPHKLNILDEAGLQGVHKNFDQSKAKPIVVGKDGYVIDGRHRAASAKQNGAKSIHAYVSAKDFYRQHVGEDQPDKAGQEAPAPAPAAEKTAQAPDKAGQKEPDADNKGGPSDGDADNVKRRGDKLDALHDDVHGYMNGKTDANSVLQKHSRLIDAMARNVAQKRGGEAEDLAQEGKLAAYKTLEALKNGTQKPKAGTHLGEHLLHRVKQGLSEGARQGNERPLSRESTKLAALVNQHRQAHTNETGSEPSEDQLFGRVSKDDNFNKAKFSAPGTKTNIEDPREKFNSLREAMKNQGSQATLDEGHSDGEGGNMGTKGGAIADPKGSAEDQALKNEAEKEMAAKKEQLHGALEEFGLSPHERHAVAHRFGVGHHDATGAVRDWDTVAKHMSKDMGKQVSVESAKTHFKNGRTKLFKHIGDERMGMLMEKSLESGDPALASLVYMLHSFGIYDLLKSQGMAFEEQVEDVWERTNHFSDYSNLVKSLRPTEYVENMNVWANGEITAEIHRMYVRG